MENCYGASLISKLEPDYVTKIISEAPPAPGKAPFQIRFNLVSTIFPEDQSICQFLNVYHTNENEVSDDNLISVLQNLQHLTELLAIQYMPLIINNLLEVMKMRRNNKPQFAAFRTLVIVLHKIRTKLQEPGIKRINLLELYSTYIFQQTFTTKHCIFEEICSNFLLYMMELRYQNSKDNSDNSVFANSWFFFDLVIKSMALKLNSEGKLNAIDRSTLFDDVFAKTLSRLLANLAKYFKDQMDQNDAKYMLEGEITLLNTNLALFISDLFSVLDRGIVFAMIRTHLQDMTHPKHELVSTFYKAQFLRIIIDNEHFIPLNLPFQLNLNHLSLDSLLKLHPGATIIISFVLETLQSDNNEIWSKTIEILYDIIVKNAFDNRYQSNSSKERIASIYFLLIPAFIESWNQLATWRERAFTKDKREFYICILYVLRTCSREMIRNWWCSEITSNQVLFLNLLCDIIQTFSYNPDEKRTSRNLFTPEIALFINKANAAEMIDVLRGVSNSNEQSIEEDPRLRLLTLEVNTLVLDVFEDLISDSKRELQRNLSKNPLMTGIIQLFCILMSKRQSRNFVHLLYASLRAFIYKFGEVLFRGNNDYLSKLLAEILIHCNFPEPDIHIESSSLLFILIKLNQKIIGSFGRTKIQAITTLSHIVQNKMITKDVVLNKSFFRISEYALHAYSTLNYRDIGYERSLFTDDKFAHSKYSTFARGIQDMCFTFSSILRDTLRITELSATADAHMIADLNYQIAEGYKNTPDLRCDWLLKLAKLQQKNTNNVEAGIAFTHASALIADYLLSSGKLDSKLFNMNIFALISPHIKEFSNSQEEGVCQSANFSAESLHTYVSFAIGCFESAEYYEFAAHLYKIITPLLEKQQDYNKLSKAYTKLQRFWQNVNDSNETRLFGKYFRVGFFGTPFGDELNLKEYVYKEPKLTHILELTDKLKLLYGEKTGKEINHIDAGKDISTIDSSECFLQITKIDPYILDDKRSTFFENNINLSNFVYETPFTQSGKSHADDASQQYKKKTIITVAGSFPSVVTRLPVIRKRDVIVTPIENAIEDVEKRNTHIDVEVNRIPINQKTLTQVLQGSCIPRMFSFFSFFFYFILFLILFNFYRG